MTILEKRAHERKPTQGRFMAKVGLDHDSKVGYIDVLNISPGGMAVRPDQTVFEHVYSDFMPGKTIIMIGQNPWNRRFSLSGTVAWVQEVFKDAPLHYPGIRKSEGFIVGIRIASTTSYVFFKKWIDEGAPQ